MSFYYNADYNDYECNPEPFEFTKCIATKLGEEALVAWDRDGMGVPQKLWRYRPTGLWCNTGPTWAGWQWVLFLAWDFNLGRTCWVWIWDGSQWQLFRDGIVREPEQDRDEFIAACLAQGWG